MSRPIHPRSQPMANDPFILKFRSGTYDLKSRSFVMGIVNVTPDSFSDGGKYVDADRAIAHGKRLADEGADFIDIGGESSRPGAAPLSADEEQRRVVPVIAALSKSVNVPISVDTTKSAVADAALAAGAEIINDITAMTLDAEMVPTVRRHDAAAILMHMQGTPQTMQREPHYDDVTGEVSAYLAMRGTAVRAAGIRSVILDPGIGFGKTLAHNVDLLRHLKQIADLGYPVLVGPSRKSFIGTILGLPVEERLEGTAAAVAFAIMNGAHIVRVHDVQHMKRVSRVIDALARG